jgi:hypothetical protein
MTSTTTTTIPKTTCLGSFTLYYLLPLPLAFGIYSPELPNVAFAIFTMADNAILDYTMCWDLGLVKFSHWQLMLQYVKTDHMTVPSSLV